MSKYYKFEAKKWLNNWIQRLDLWPHLSTSFSLMIWSTQNGCLEVTQDGHVKQMID